MAFTARHDNGHDLSHTVGVLKPLRPRNENGYLLPHLSLLLLFVARRYTNDDVSFVEIIERPRSP